MMPAAFAGNGMLVAATGDSVFDILHNDHKRIHHMLNELIETVAGREQTLMELGSLFTVHNATEENFVYPAIAEVAGRKSDAVTLYHQQDEAKMVAWQLDALLHMREPEPEHFTALATKLRAAVLEHVAMEQNVDFPKLQAALGPQGTANLTDKVRAFRQKFG